MRKVFYLIVIFVLFIEVSARVARSLFLDSAVLSFDLSTADFVIEGPLTLIENKPLTAESFVPGQWSEYGKLKLTNPNSESVNFYMFVTETDGKACADVNIMLEVSDNGDDDWATVYEGEIEDIRGSNDKVPLTINEDMSKRTIYLRQKVQLKEDADKNTAGNVCLWDEVFRLENDDEDIKDDFVLSRNDMTVFYWIPPKTEVKEPDKHKEYEAGNEIKINWKVKSHTHDQEDSIKIGIYLYNENGGNLLMTIGENLENKGPYKWTPPTDLLGNDFKIKITAEDTHGLTNEDFSDESFSITPEE